MRLIDADNIISVCEILSEKGNDPHYWNQLILIIEDAPTIDAIPVEWIKARHKNWCWDSDRSVCERFLLDDWHQEQEGDDETD